MVNRYFLVIALLFGYTAIHAQTAADYAIQVNAQVQQSPPQITLTWKAAPAGSYTIYKKAKQATSFGTAITTVPGTQTTYIDNSVSPDTTYEYAIIQTDTPAYGYINAAISAPAIHNRGAILLLVDSTFTDSCNAEIAQLVKDISGDGWQVLRKDFLRTTALATVKDYIKAQHTAYSNLQAVLILGHISVPYSGNIYPDGHTDHQGAWPADVYYGDIDGIWTDNSVNNTTATRTANDNIPGDGKFDQNFIPSDVELQVSRIDFANMPAFTQTEVQLMKSYLAKNHSYKVANLMVTKRALISTLR